MIPLSTPDTYDGGDDDGGYTPETVRRALAGKDEGLISDKGYHELRMAFTGNLKKKSKRKIQNDEIKIMHIPEVFDH